MIMPHTDITVTFAIQLTLALTSARKLRGVRVFVIYRHKIVNFLLAEDEPGSLNCLLNFW